MSERQAEVIMEQRKITHLGLLDLRHLRTVDELNTITEISHVGTILLSEQLEGSINKIPMHHIGSIVVIPSDLKVKLLSGDLKLQGDFLENLNGDPEETLLITGELLIMSSFQKIGYKSIIITGEIFAPKECEYMLTSSISQWYGELHFYKNEPKMFSGQDRFGHDFFSYLKNPVTLLLRGEFYIEADVSIQLLQEKVSELFLWGDIYTADSKQASQLLALTALKYGAIRAVQA